MYKYVRTLGVIVYKNKGVWLWLWGVFTFDFILQTMMLCGSCPPNPPATRSQARTIYQLEWDTARGKGLATRTRMCYSRVS